MAGKLPTVKHKSAPKGQASPAPVALREEKAKTEALFASIGEGIIATDAHGKIIRINQAAERLLECKENDLLGTWFPESVQAIRPDGTQMEYLERPVTKAIVGGETVSERLAYRTRTGRIMPVSVTVSPVLLDGKPAGAIEIFRDISIEIQSEKLKTDFISIASHQLRTPLSAISLYAQMLSDGLAGKLNDQQQSFLETTIAATKRMNDLISTLLNITRIEAGSIAIDPRPMELVPLVADLIREFTPEAERKSITLRFTPSDEDHSIYSDPLLIREVLSNLVSNAIKYTPNGGSVSVDIRQKGTQTLCTVQDTGYGIPASSQQYIFTKFFRADNIIAQDVSGTGLGLYLTKTIVENLQGELWFDSLEDSGTTFYMSLPKEGVTKRAGSFKIEA